LVRIALALAALVPAFAADLASTLREVESKYNKIKTLQVQFEQRNLVQGRPRRIESGRLFLLKPGRMRWEYADPAGKLFVSDGKDLYFYSPATHRVEKSKLKQMEDFRAPLAFLLGKLDFDRDFQDFESRTESDATTTITAIPRSDQLPYSRVQFSLTPARAIQRLVVTGQDGTTLDFTFTGEKTNPALPNTLFRFVLPAGAELVEVNQ
jgi:outer membrane lipoprotein carrier protein